MPRNRLQSETSPYLLQHADNPVDWHPWGEAALALAREQDKPILLSIGYSACHWCHVMAHESFEDEEVAAVMNDRFVNIKVDREERPDLDKIYQLAYQLIARRGGGWPLTVFLNPHNHLPIYAGTYFPKTPRYQLPGFIGILEQVADHYQRDKSAIASNERAFTQAFAAINRDEPGSAPNADLIELAKRHLVTEFDGENGGFGGAPKFPHITSLEFLLNLWWLSGQRDGESLNIVTTSLRKMAEGGLQDQIGGGFCRYSVDAQWEIPHFEKMLYDNGPLLGLYAEAYRATGDAYFQNVAEATATWAIRDMQSPEGGFYSSLDADSEGHEGKFYVWDRHEIRRLLPPQEYAVVERHYGLDQPANFEGHWHLRVAEPLTETANALGIPEDDAACLLLSARAILYSTRIHRIPPGLDDKLLTAWNGLMIKGLATAGRLLDREDFIDAAERAFDFIVARCRDGERRLWATYKDGRAHLPAYLDDYAYLLDAGLALLQSRWNTATLNRLIGWAETLLAAFEDRHGGGFFFTADDHEQLIHRPKSFSDESMASGNGIAALALARLGHLLGESRYLETAARTLQAGGGSMRRYPSGHGALLLAALDELNPPEMIIIHGTDPEELAAWRACAEQKNPRGPRRLIHALANVDDDLPGLLKARGAVDGTTAYLCTDSECREPIRSLAEWTAACGG